MEWIPTKVETQHESFVPDQYQPGGGRKEQTSTMRANHEIISQAHVPKN